MVGLLRDLWFDELSEEIPVFLACAVTPHIVVMRAKPELCITHILGHMFISDVLNEELAAF